MYDCRELTNSVLNWSKVLILCYMNNYFVLRTCRSSFRRDHCSLFKAKVYLPIKNVKVNSLLWAYSSGVVKYLTCYLSAKIDYEFQLEFVFELLVSLTVVMEERVGRAINKTSQMYLFIK